MATYSLLPCLSRREDCGQPPLTAKTASEEADLIVSHPAVETRCRKSHDGAEVEVRGHGGKLILRL